MAATIKIKNSSTASAVPTSSDLVQGELAVNVTDKRIFTENASGTVVELGTNPSILTLPDGSASAPTLTNDGDTNTGIFFPAADTVGITTGGTERARVDSSGNLGIGTSSPSYRLDAQGTVTDANVARIKPLAGSSSTTVVLDVQAGDSSTLFKVLNSGNAGLGVTPSGSLTGYKIFEIGSTGNQLFSAANDLFLSTNAYYSSGWKYGTSTYASQYEQTAGKHQWYTAASGTAGNAITFTQAMTLDASGNLGIGITSPVSNNSGARALQLDGGSYGVDLRLTNTATGATATNGSAVALDSTNFYLWNYENAFMAFGTNNTERARIDSSGNLLVGNTSATPGAARIQSTFDGSARNGIDVRTTYTGGTSYLVSFFNNASSNIGSITTNGSTTAYNTSSDYRLKENIAPMVGALSVVAQLKPCTYTWKADGTEGQGFIAHELQEVVPDAVTGEKDAVNQDGSIKPQGIDTSFLVATLTAAIQELKAEFDAYKATHP